MAEYQYGICAPWVTVDEFVDCCDELEEDTPLSTIENAIMIASGSLYLLSGSVFKGECERTLEVLPTNCRNDSGMKRPLRSNEINIGYWPVTSIESVTFDGVEQDEDNFRINDFRFLEKLDGKWPIQPGETDAEVFVTFTYGVKPPPAGIEAAKQLTNEIVQGCMGKKCKLPDRVSSVARRGVTLTFGDYKQLSQDFLGNYFVDLFLQSVNPTKARAQSFVVKTSSKAKTRRIGT